MTHCSLLAILILSAARMATGNCLQAAQWEILESADTLLLSMNGRDAGTFFQTLTVDNDAGLIRLERRIAVGTSGGAPSASPGMDLTEHRTYGFDGQLRAAQQAMAGASGTSTWRLSRDKKGPWRLTVTAGGQKQEVPAAEVTEHLLTTRALMQGIRKRTVSKGAVFLDTAFELTSGRNIVTSIRCMETPGAENKQTWRFICRSSVLDRDEAWHLDTLGNTVYQELYPFVARKKTGTPDTARDGSPFSLFSLIEALSVKVSRPAGPKETVRLTFEQGLSPDTSAAAFYRQEKDAWLVTGIARSCPGPQSSAVPAGDFDRFTSASATMQSGDARIRRLADSLCRRKTDRCDSIRACFSHVNKRLEKRYAPTFSNALETLEAGYGDCGEHAVLLGALLRAARIPARIVLGLVYVEESKGYFYHAWVMAESNGQWVFVDPARGAFPAVRDLVPLSIDDTGADMLRIARLIGKFRIDYVKRTHE
ncbi:MAG: transglutaminase domain-containing protein [Chitinispirillaceae bacterium]|nr:transglutaminase domain-containing protein [Chitinispirillaceae bacterium]